jgi:hypothetical protein
MSTLFNNVSKSDHAPSTQGLLLCKTTGDQKVPQPKASADQNTHKHQNATVEVVKRFMEGIIFMGTTSPILSNNKYLLVEDPWKLAIDAQDHQQALPGASEGMPSVCQLPSGPFFKIVPQTQKGVSFCYCLMLHY